MKIHQLFLFTSDLEAQRRFYISVLGLREIEPPGPAYEMAVQVGFSILIFRQAPADWHGRYHLAFGVPTDSFDASRHWLAQRAKAMTDQVGNMIFHSESWKTTSLYFLDLAGNILELIARDGKEGPEPEGQPRIPLDDLFGPHRLLGITEIGIACYNVEGAAAELMQNAPGIKPYREGQMDRFRPIGDDEGLFILVSRGRIWYPETGVPAELHPLEVLFEVENGMRYRLSAPPYPFTVRPS